MTPISISDGQPRAHSTIEPSPAAPFILPEDVGATSMCSEKELVNFMAIQEGSGDLHIWDMERYNPAAMGCYSDIVRTGGSSGTAGTSDAS